MIKKVIIRKFFGGKGELSNFHSVGEAMKMKNILRNKTAQISLALLIIFTIQTQVFTHPAFARSSGGGNLAKFDTGKFALSVGIGLVSSVAGKAITSGISNVATNTGTFAAGAGNALSSYGRMDSWISSYNSMAALNQLGSAISMTGQAEGWDVSTTTFVSSMAQGVVGGALNPSSTLGAAGISNSTIKAMGVGAISGAVEGGILANNVIRSNDSDIHGTQNPWVSAGANLAGAFAGGIASASIAAVIPKKEMQPRYSSKPSYNDMITDDPEATYGSLLGLDGSETASLDGEPLSGPKLAEFKDKYTKFVDSPVSGAGYNALAKVKVSEADNINRGEPGSQANSNWPTMVRVKDVSVPKYNKPANFGQVLTNGAVRAFSAIPSSAVSMGVSSITKDMDKQDAFMVRQAFSGVYPIVGTVYNNGIKDPVFEKIGLENYTGYKNGSLSPSYKQDVTTFEGPKIKYSK